MAEAKQSKKNKLCLCDCHVIELEFSIYEKSKSFNDKKIVLTAFKNQTQQQKNCQIKNGTEFANDEKQFKNRFVL